MEEKQPDNKEQVEFAKRRKRLLKGVLILGGLIGIVVFAASFFTFGSSGPSESSGRRGSDCYDYTAPSGKTYTRCPSDKLDNTPHAVSVEENLPSKSSSSGSQQSGPDLLGEPSRWTCEPKSDGSIFTSGTIRNNTNRTLSRVVYMVYLHDANRDFLTSSPVRIIDETSFAPGEYSGFSLRFTPSVDIRKVSYCSWVFNEGLGGPKLSGVSASLVAD